MMADAHNGENDPPPANTEPMPTRIVAVASIWRADGRSPTKMVERINEYTGSVCISSTPATAPMRVSP